VHGTLQLGLLIFFFTGIVSLRCSLLPSQPLSSPVSSCLLSPHNVTLKVLPHIWWHISAMDHLRPAPSQMLFQSSRTTSSFLRMTIVGSPSGIKIFTMFTIVAGALVAMPILSARRQALLM